MKHNVLISAAIVLPFLLLGADTAAISGLEQPQTIGSTTAIMLEAESAVLSGPMKVAIDGEAFGNLCIHGYHVNRRGWATFEVMIPTAGDYVIWGRVKGRDEFTNSFFVQVDGGEEMIWEFGKQDKYEWRRVSSRGTGTYTNPQYNPVIFRFTAGRHVIVIGNREKETRLDRLVITNNLEAWYEDAPAKSIHLIAPQQGDHILPGSTFEIKWEAFNTAATVNIDLSIDLGANFNIPVVHGAPNTGSYLWAVPAGLNRPKVIMRITAAGGPSDIHRGYFAVVPAGKPSITVTAPNGGETLRAGTIYVIKWKEYAFNGLTQILFSPDNGATWQVIAEHQNAGGENYWLVPNVISNQCLIKVQDTKDGQPWDQSNATFRIIPAGLAKGTAEEGALPIEFNLLPNYPNPFNPQTTITYELPEEANVNLSVYDLQGRRVAVLVDGYCEAGRRQVVWNAADMPSGVYMAVLQAGSERRMQRMTLIK